MCNRDQRSVGSFVLRPLTVRDRGRACLLHFIYSANNICKNDTTVLGMLEILVKQFSYSLYSQDLLRF